MGPFGIHAHKFWELGYNVLPAYGKKGALTKWQLACHIRQTETEVDSLAHRWPDHNIGVACGPAGCQVIDLDSDNPRIMAFLRSISPMRKIGKKGMSVFVGPGSFPPERFSVGDIDFLGDNSFTVIPPSIHPEIRKEYRWDVGSEVLPVEELPVLSRELFAELMKILEEEPQTRPLRTGKTADGKQIVGAKGRQSELSGKAYGMYMRGLSKEEAVEQIIELDEKFFGENSWFRTDPENSGLSVVQAAQRMINLKWKYVEHITPNNIEPEFPALPTKHRDVSNLSLEEMIEGLSFFKSSGKPDLYAMATFLKGSLFHVSEESGDYFYNSKQGRFEFINDKKFENFIMRLTKDSVDPSALDQFKRIARGKNYVEDFFGDPVPGLINLASGVLNVKNGNHVPHSAEYRMRYTLPICYDPNATAPTWQAFLRDIFNGDLELITLTKEMFAYTLIGGDPFLHRAFCLYGTGRNGKSTLLNVLRGLCGPENCSIVPLKMLDRPFSVVTMDAKILNVCEETPSDSINSEFFKTAVGGGQLQAANKNKPEYAMTVRARFVFACNEMPVFKDASHGLSDRLVFLPFTRYFSEQERDTELDAKLRAEYSGIINDIIPVARKLVESRKLSTSYRSAELKEDYKLSSCTVYGWMHEAGVVTTEPEWDTDRDSIYRVYVSWCEDGKRFPVSREAFTKRLVGYVRDGVVALGVPADSACTYKLPRLGGRRPKAIRHFRLTNHSDE
jgi:P4 family phage/plasmid primase-like protien